mmetsp:Transcript_85823/g.195655  ORF Transcript_85823/g.195655 Transcript_85823/m.195655 type:complete len:254 (-) Transcript_85823:46-807(-)
MAALSHAVGRAPQGAAPAWSLPILAALRTKMTKRMSYDHEPDFKRRPGLANIGEKATPGEYVEAGRVIVKQRKYINKNLNAPRKRNQKLYPGENIRVLKNLSLAAVVSGRVKYTHDVTRDVVIANVLPEPREELLPTDMWRYRREHVACMEENKEIIQLRSKALLSFGRDWVNQPEGIRPRWERLSNRRDHWNNRLLRDPLEIEPMAYSMSGALLKRHLTKIFRKHAGLPDTDPEFITEDPQKHLLRGQSAQR